MSVVAAWWSPTQAVMAADRCMSFGGKEMMSTDDKVLVVSGADGSALLGIAGYMDYADWWREKLDLPHRDPAIASLYTCFARVRNMLKDFVSEQRARGDGRVDDDKWHLGFEGLLVCRDGLFYLYGDGSMAKSPMSYGAIGTGAEVAMGALFAQSYYYAAQVGDLPEQLVGRSVHAAITHSRGCGFGTTTRTAAWASKESSPYSGST